MSTSSVPQREPVGRRDRKRSLPTGNVTFLFTDIEGSTALLTELGADFLQVRDRHDHVIRAAIEQGGGIEIATEGDSFFAAFPTAVGALRAAVAAQRALSAAPETKGRRVEARMGLHTGEGQLGGASYVGIDVHRAARIASAGHGGQVLLSDATRGLVESQLPDGVTLRDLGSHRLKDLPQPEHLHDLLIAGIRTDFPALRSMSARPTNLPLQLTSFVGRHHEVSDVVAQLEVSRLVTLTGTGGAGKTRLAVEAAGSIVDRFPDGVWFVDLSSAVDDESVLGLTADALAIKHEPGRSPLESLFARLAQSKTLLVQDNCEQVLDAVADLAVRILGRSPEVRILATSREALAIPGEVVRPVPPLGIPETGTTSVDAVAVSDAVRLLVERASAVDPAFRLRDDNVAAVASICRRLDGVPLALELAAAQMGALGPAQIDARLGDRFALLRGAARGDPRHRTLETVLAWSYDLLDDLDRALLDRLAVFRGTFSMDAAEAVVMDEPIDRANVLDGILRLVRKSLVVPESRGPEHRYRLLETVREYAAARLVAAGDLDRRRDRHLEWVLDLATRAAQGLSGEAQVGWLDALDDDLENIEAALAWSLGDPDRAALALEAVNGLTNYWMARGTRRAQGTRWLEATAAAATGLDVAARTEALMNAVLLAMWSDLAAASALAEAATRVAGDDPAGRARAEIAAAYVAWFRGNASAGDHAEAALELMDAEDPSALWARAANAWARSEAGALEEAHGMLMDVARQFRQPGDDHLFGALESLAADFGAANGDLDRSAGEARESLAIAQRVSCASCESQALATLALADPCADMGGRVAVARKAVRLADGIGEVFNVLCALEVLVGGLAMAGEVENGVLLGAATSAIRGATGYAPAMPGRARAARDGLELARRELDAVRFEKIGVVGATLDYDAAVRFALGESLPNAAPR
jgi:predicted ATPase/class 3 adenylate cyclase